MLDEALAILDRLEDDDLTLRSSVLCALAGAETERGADGLPLQQRSLDAAMRSGNAAETARQYTNLYSTAVAQLRLEDFDWAYTDGLAYALDHDAFTYTACIRGARAAYLLRRGELGAATRSPATWLRRTSPR